MVENNRNQQEHRIGTRRKNSTCSRLRWEFRDASLFGLRDANGEMLDVRKSFAPQSWFPQFLRILFFISSACTMLADLYLYPKENIMVSFGYLTYWTWAICILYQSVAVALVVSNCCCSAPSNTNNKAGILVKILWVLYSIAAPGELVVATLYWWIDHDDTQPIEYFGIFKHATVGFLILLDGAILVCTIPVRIKHFIFFQLYNSGFLVWTYLQMYCEIGSVTYEDDTVYEVLKWNHDLLPALMLSVLIV
mmetsp:Transcript_15279/g.23791  ORF Transcript_15279/g.23791 Transcript_15279/m.23791 type:complete len:250 (-) Transcript_15279:1705-2454(-)